MTKLFFLIISWIQISLINSIPNVSTQYYFVPEGQTKCSEEFPSGFSLFLESEDAYGEYSEYYKVCSAINRTLDIFPTYAVNLEDENDEKWIEIKTLKDSLKSYLNELEMIPYDSLNLKYDRRKETRDSLNDRILTSKNHDDNLWAEFKRIDYEITNDTQHPFYFLPPDRKYISGKKLNFDLNHVISILDCYSKEGHRRVKIVYE